MNYLVNAAAFLCLMSLMACTIGNGHICGPQTPQTYCDREAYERLMHPKGFGEYWDKPEKTVDSWRADWVKCGGRVDGGYSTDEPPRSSTAVILAASKKKRLELGSCMRSKGYNITREWD